MRSISVKELRERLQDIIGEVQAGRSYTLIFRSKPVLELKPLSRTETRDDQGDGFMSWLDANKTKFRTKKNAVQLVREERSR